MMDTTRFIETIRRIVREEREQKFALGTIPSDYSSGLPNVRFDEETQASVRERPYLDSYTPAANDRVLLARVGRGWVVLGKVVS